MTAAELAELLTGLPDDAEVRIYEGDCGSESPLTAWTVATTKDGTRLVLGREDYYS